MSFMLPPIRPIHAMRRSPLEAALRWTRDELRSHGEAIFCRGTGVALIANLALFPGRFSPAARTIARAYAYRFWRPANLGEWLDIIFAFLLWPGAVLISVAWLAWKNGGVVARSHSHSRARQCVDQLRLALTSGLLPPWYYVFELYEAHERKNALAYLTRGQTKHGANRLFVKALGSSSPLADKEAFSRFCARHELRTLPVLFSVHDACLRGITGPDELMKADLFVKPVCERGGRGAERWDFVADGLYRDVAGRILSGGQLLGRLREMSRWQPFLVQERARNHHALWDLGNGALSTVRIITCLDERGWPEMIGAVLKMAIGTNVTVDNVHAGGIAAPVDLRSGRLGQATHAGFDARRGWIDRHPQTGAMITGRTLPRWEQLCELVRKAHWAFCDWVVIGWDVAILAEGPSLVEGNQGPDIDLIQRPLRTGFGDSRLGELIAFHLDRTEAVWRS
jgi:hypothetical protein